MTVFRAPLYSNDLRPGVRTLPLCLSLHVSWNGDFIFLRCCFIFSPFLPLIFLFDVGCFVRCLFLFALCLSHFITCQAIRALMFLHAQLHFRQQQSGAFFFFPFLKTFRVNKCWDGSAFWQGVRVRSNWGWASGAKGQSGWQAGGSTQWSRQQQFAERGRPNAQLHANLTAVFCMLRQVERATVLHNWTLHLSSLKGWAC